MKSAFCEKGRNEKDDGREDAWAENSRVGWLRQSPVFIKTPRDAGNRRNEMKKAVILLAAATLVTLLGACGGDVSTDRGEETEQETLVESVESVESETETVSAEGEEETESMESAAEAASTESEEETTSTEAEEETADTESTESEAAAASEADTAAAQTTVESAAAPAADTAAAEAANEAAPAAAAGAAAANTAGSLLETAKSFEGASVDALIQAIGQPISSDYAPSCLGEGEDGNLYYDGFTVYTYRDATGEVVSYVE